MTGLTASSGDPRWPLVLGPQPLLHPTTCFINGGKTGSNGKVQQWPNMRHLRPDVKLYIISGYRRLAGEGRRSRQKDLFSPNLNKRRRQSVKVRSDGRCVS